MSDSLQSPEVTSQIAAVAALNEPIRRALYGYVLRQPGAVGRDEAAQAVNISRELAAFHLDKLVELELLDVEFRRLTGRRGPGAGRPAKLYRVSDRQLAVTVPERRYELAARLLAEAFAEGTERSVAVAAVARRFGERLGAEARPHLGRRPSRKRLLETASDVLRRHGFEPVGDGGEVRLRNCPFDTLARDHTLLVCGMNLHIAEGLLSGLGAAAIEARLDPQPGHCCVALAPSRARRR